jgi:hypothetical protein
MFKQKFHANEETTCYLEGGKKVISLLLSWKFSKSSCFVMFYSVVYHVFSLAKTLGLQEESGKQSARIIELWVVDGIDLRAWNQRIWFCSVWWRENLQNLLKKAVFLVFLLCSIFSLKFICFNNFQFQSAYFFNGSKWITLYFREMHVMNWTL